jgi:hypothetical protein
MDPIAELRAAQSSTRDAEGESSQPALRSTELEVDADENERGLAVQDMEPSKDLSRPAKSAMRNYSDSPSKAQLPSGRAGIATAATSTSVSLPEQISKTALFEERASMIDAWPSDIYDRNKVQTIDDDALKELQVKEQLLYSFSDRSYSEGVNAETKLQMCEGKLLRTEGNERAQLSENIDLEARLYLRHGNDGTYELQTYQKEVVAFQDVSYDEKDHRVTVEGEDIGYARDIQDQGVAHLCIYDDFGPVLAGDVRENLAVLDAARKSTRNQRRFTEKWFLEGDASGEKVRRAFERAKREITVHRDSLDPTVQRCEGKKDPSVQNFFRFLGEKYGKIFDVVPGVTLKSPSAEYYHILPNGLNKLRQNVPSRIEHPVAQGDAAISAFLAKRLRLDDKKTVYDFLQDRDPDRASSYALIPQENGSYQVSSLRNKKVQMHLTQAVSEAAERLQNEKGIFKGDVRDIRVRGLDFGKSGAKFTGGNEGHSSDDDSDKSADLAECPGYVLTAWTGPEVVTVSDPALVAELTDAIKALRGRKYSHLRDCDYSHVGSWVVKAGTEMGGEIDDFTITSSSGPAAVPEDVLPAELGDTVKSDSLPSSITSLFPREKFVLVVTEEDNKDIRGIIKEAIAGPLEHAADEPHWAKITAHLKPDTGNVEDRDAGFRMIGVASPSQGGWTPSQIHSDNPPAKVSGQVGVPVQPPKPSRPLSDDETAAQTPAGSSSRKSRFHSAEMKDVLTNARAMLTAAPAKMKEKVHHLIKNSRRDGGRRD